MDVLRSEGSRMQEGNNMVTLYVTSPEAYSGKSALCVGLGRHFRREGYTIGYMKPAIDGRRCQIH